MGLYEIVVLIAGFIVYIGLWIKWSGLIVIFNGLIFSYMMMVAFKTDWFTIGTASLLEKISVLAIVTVVFVYSIVYYMSQRK